jgi:hypothetical protein
MEYMAACLNALNLSVVVDRPNIELVKAETETATRRLETELLQLQQAEKKLGELPKRRAPNLRELEYDAKECLEFAGNIESRRSTQAMLQKC